MGFEAIVLEQLDIHLQAKNKQTKNEQKTPSLPKLDTYTKINSEWILDTNVKILGGKKEKAFRT